MEDAHHDIDIVLAKYLSGQATPDEAIQVADWIHSSEENKKIMTRLQQSWNLTQTTEGLKQQVWKEIQKSINSEKRKSRTFFIEPYRWAAGIAILLVAGLALYQFSRKKLVTETVAWITTESEDQVLKHGLQDSSHVVLSKNSSIRYPEKFGRDQREVELKGEAYFNVTSETTKPFIVKVDALSIKVLGTQFNVKSDSVLNLVEVAVTEGKVMFSSKSDSIVIKKGWYGRYDLLKDEFTLHALEEHKTNALAYATGSFAFDESTFIEIAEQLEKVYNVSIIFENERIAQCKIHATFKDESLDFILDVLCTVVSSSYSKTGDTIEIKGNGCQ